MLKSDDSLMLLFICPPWLYKVCTPTHQKHLLIISIYQKHFLQKLSLSYMLQWRDICTWLVFCKWYRFKPRDDMHSKGYRYKYSFGVVNGNIGARYAFGLHLSFSLSSTVIYHIYKHIKYLWWEAIINHTDIVTERRFYNGKPIYLWRQVAVDLTLYIIMAAWVIFTHRCRMHYKYQTRKMMLWALS